MLQRYREARDEVRAEVIGVVESLREANKRALKALESSEAEALENAREPIKNLSDKTEKIDNDIVRIFVKFSPEARDLREMVSYLKITSALNRIRTNINNYLKNMQHIVTLNSQNIHQIIRESLKINRSTLNSFDYMLEMLQTFDDNDKVKDLAQKIEIEYSKTDDIYSVIEKEVIQKISDSYREAEEYFNLLKYIRKNLKIIDKLEAISRRVIFARIGGKL
jgi:phosphate transport system protein